MSVEAPLGFICMQTVLSVILCVCVCWLIEAEPVITLIGSKVGRTQDTAPSSPERGTPRGGQWTRLSLSLFSLSPLLLCITLPWIRITLTSRKW